MTTESHSAERLKQEQCMTTEASVNDFEKSEEKAGRQSGKTCFSREKRDFSLGIRVVRQKGRKRAKYSKYEHFAACCKVNRSPPEWS